MSFIRTLARTLLSYFLIFIIGCIILIPAIIFFLMPEKWRHRSNFFFTVKLWMMRSILKSLFVPIKFEGLEYVPNEPAIIVVNHQSALDMPLVTAALGKHPHVWLAWAALMKSYVLRLFLPKVAVLIDTSSPHKATRSLIKAIATVKYERLHAVIFPEGGRFIDGDVHEFYGGFVVLSKKTERPVLPIRIFNVNKAFPPGAFLLHWTPIKVVIGPLMYQGADESDAIFKDRVYEWFVQQTGE